MFKIRDEYEDLNDYFPDERDLHKLPRYWVANVIYTIIGDAFRMWVAEKIRERNDKVAASQDLMIDLDPAIARAFEASTMISSKYQEEIKSQTKSIL